MNYTSATIVFAAIVQSVTFATEGYFAYERLTTPPPIEGSAVAPEHVRAGETVPVVWSILKRTECPGENGRIWRGENGFFVSEMMRVSGLPVTDEFVQYTIPTTIPDFAPVGPLELEISGFNQCSGQERETFTLGPVFMTVVE